MSDLEMRLAGTQHTGILLVVVPTSRLVQAQNVLKSEFELHGQMPWRLQQPGTPIVITVISWDDALAALRRVEDPSFRAELDQFEAMYRELGSTFIAPLAGLNDLLDWRTHEKDLIRLIDRVTRILTVDRAVLPIGIDPPEKTSLELEPRGYTRRYVCRQLGPGKETCFSIGVRDPFAGSVTPVWMRFNKTTGRFLEIRARLEASSVAPGMLISSGHIWIPLEVPVGVAAEQMVDAIVKAAQEISDVAYSS